MKSSIFKSRLAVRYIVYYATIFVLPLFTLLFVLFPIQNRINISSSEEKLKDTGYKTYISAEALLENIYKLYPQIMANSQLTSYALAQGPYAEIDAVNELKRIVALNTSYYDVIIFSMERNTLYAAGRLIRAEKLDNWYNEYNFVNWSTDQFLSYVRNQKKNDILSPIVMKKTPVDKESVVLFVFPLSQFQINRNILIIAVKESAFKQILDCSTSFSLGNTLFFSSKGKLITAYKNPEVNVVRYLNTILSEPSGLTLDIPVSVRIDDTEYMCMYKRSLQCNGYYITIIPMESFYSETRRLQIQELIILAILTGFESLLIFTFATKSYSPLRALSSKAISYVDVEDRKDEIKVIENAISKLWANNLAMQEKMATLIPTQREYYLRAFLHGLYKTRVEINTVGAEFGLNFKYEQFTVVAVKAVDGQDLSFFIMEIDQKKASDNQHQVFSLPMTDHNITLLIICHKAETEIRKYIENVQAELEMNYGIITIMSAGKTCADISDLKNAYAQVIGIIDRLDVIEPGSSLLSVEAADLSAASLPEWPIESLYQLSTAVHRRNEEAINKNFCALMNYLTDDTYAIESRYSVYQNIISLLLQPMNREENVISDFIPVLFDNSKNPKIWVANAEKSKNCLQVFYDNKRKASKNTLINDMFDYVNTHYLDADFTINSVAEYFRMTPSGFSRFFSEAIGTSFKGYIDEIKIKMAVDLLTNTNYSIESIAEKCGYGNSSSFIRAFKRINDITPGEYRKMTRERTEKENF